MVKLSKCMPQLEIGSPIAYKSMAIVPLLANENHAPVKYLLLSDAINNGLLEITEVSESGSVPELLVKNIAEEMVLILDGEELVGAKQNRIANTSIMLGANTTTHIKVSCVERGRWHKVSNVFSTGNYAPPAMRGLKSRVVTRNLVAQGIANADQCQIWDQVEHYMRCSGTHSATDALYDVYGKRESEIAEMAEKLTYLVQMCGCLVAINGRFVAMDLFGDTEALAKIWQRALKGYVIDSMLIGANSEVFSKEDAEKLVAELKEKDCIVCPSAGLGEDWRFDSGDIAGSALVLDGQGIHLCAFSNGGDSDRPELFSGLGSPGWR